MRRIKTSLRRDPALDKLFALRKVQRTSSLSADRLSKLLQAGKEGNPALDDSDSTLNQLEQTERDIEERKINEIIQHLYSLPYKEFLAEIKDCNNYIWLTGLPVTWFEIIGETPEGTEALYNLLVIVIERIHTTYFYNSLKKQYPPNKAKYYFECIKTMVCKQYARELRKELNLKFNRGVDINSLVAEYLGYSIPGIKQRIRKAQKYLKIKRFSILPLGIINSNSLKDFLMSKKKPE